MKLKHALSSSKQYRMPSDLQKQSQDNLNKTSKKNIKSVSNRIHAENYKVYLGENHSWIGLTPTAFGNSQDEADLLLDIGSPVIDFLGAQGLDWTAKAWYL